MRAGIAVTLFCSALCAVQARPASEEKRDLIDNITKVAEEILTADLAPILQSITPEAETLFGEATSARKYLSSISWDLTLMHILRAVGSFLASNTALGHEATAIVSAVESKATQVEQDIASKNGASHTRGLASRSLGVGLATALGGVLLGAYVVL